MLPSRELINQIVDYEKENNGIINFIPLIRDSCLTVLTDFLDNTPNLDKVHFLEFFNSNIDLPVNNNTNLLLIANQNAINWFRCSLILKIYAEENPDIPEFDLDEVNFIENLDEIFNLLNLKINQENGFLEENIVEFYNDNVDIGREIYNEKISI